jgi:transposase
MSTKIHQLVDGNGLPLVTLITPGQAADSPMFLPLMSQLGVRRNNRTEHRHTNLSHDRRSGVTARWGALT